MPQREDHPAAAVAPAARPDVQHGTRSGGGQLEHLPLHLGEAHALVLPRERLGRLPVPGVAHHVPQPPADRLAAHRAEPTAPYKPVKPAITECVRPGKAGRWQLEFRDAGKVFCIPSVFPVKILCFRCQ
ncbi:hypothetical protein GPN2_14012 [Streptomyces murinus]